MSGDERATAPRDAAGDVRHAAPASSQEGPGHVCTVGFCPISMALAAVGQAKPDAVEHLVLAGRQFLLAAKALLDARADDVGGAGARLERIDVR